MGLRTREHSHHGDDESAEEIEIMVHNEAAGTRSTLKIPKGSTFKDALQKLRLTRRAGLIFRVHGRQIEWNEAKQDFESNPILQQGQTLLIVSTFIGGKTV